MTEHPTSAHILTKLGHKTCRRQTRQQSWAWGFIFYVSFILIAGKAEAAGQTKVDGQLAAQAHEKLMAAKRLIVDAFPEDRDTAEELMIDAIRILPNDAEIYAELARFTLWQIAMGSKDPLELQKASQLATQVCKLAPDRPLGNFIIAEILLAMGQQPQALLLFKETADKFPNHLDTRVFETRFYAESNPRRALESAQIALAAGHSIDDLSPALTLALVTLSKGGSAGDALAKFAEVYPDRWLWHRAGMAYVEEKKAEKARTAFYKAIGLGNQLESRLQLGILEYTVLNEPKKALKDFSELSQFLTRRSNFKKDSMALIATHAAIAALSENNWKIAQDQGQQALKFGANNENITAVLIDEFKRKNKIDLLWSGLVLAAKENPMLDSAHIALGIIATEKKDFPTAMEYLGNALALAPDRDDLYSAHGHAAYMALNYDSALVDFEHAIEIHPNQSNYHYNRSCMLALLGRKDEAIASLKTALQLNHDLLQIAVRDLDLQGLRNDKHYEGELVSLGLHP